jgi:hypothetical protein
VRPKTDQATPTDARFRAFVGAACYPIGMSCCGLQCLRIGPRLHIGRALILALMAPTVNIERCVYFEQNALNLMVVRLYFCKSVANLRGWRAARNIPQAKLVRPLRMAPCAVTRPPSKIGGVRCAGVYAQGKPHPGPRHVEHPPRTGACCSTRAQRGTGGDCPRGSKYRPTPGSCEDHGLGSAPPPNDGNAARLNLLHPEATTQSGRGRWSASCRVERANLAVSRDLLPSVRATVRGD